MGQNRKSGKVLIQAREMEMSNSLGQVAAASATTDPPFEEVKKRSDEGFEYVFRAALVQCACAVIGVFFGIVVMGLASWPEGLLMLASLIGALGVGLTGMFAYISTRRSHDINKSSTIQRLWAYFVLNIICVVLNFISLPLDTYYLYHVAVSTDEMAIGVHVGVVATDVLISILLIAVQFRVLLVVNRSWAPLTSSDEDPQRHIPLHGL